MLFTDLADKYEKLRGQVAGKLSSLSDLLQSRKQFEDEVDKCEHWLNQAEVASSADMRTTNVALLEELLTKVLKCYMHGKVVTINWEKY